MTGLLTLAAEFNPADEFKLNEWVSIHLGPIDMSINKAVVYLAISALVTIFIGVFTMRSRLTLIARDDEGTVHRMTWLRAVVERKGRVKIYSTDD